MIGFSRLAGVAVSGLFWLVLAAAAHAAETTKYYEITGKTGMELLRDMNRKGPRRGFLTKDIAQTQFKSDLRGDIVHHDGICRTKNARFSMHITYVYPRPAHGLDAALAKRWQAFHASNVKHEQMHGRLGRKLIADVNGALRSFRMADSQHCRKADAALTRQLDAIIIAYNKSQKEFDQREHRKGGPVEKSIVALIGKKK